MMFNTYIMETCVKNKQKNFVGLKTKVLKFYYFVVDIFLKHNDYIFRPPQPLKSIFYLPYVKKDFIQQLIYRKKQYFEQENLDYICKKWENGLIGHTLKNSSVLDVGANIGNHTLYYLNECHAKSAYCFEPVPDTFRILSKNIEIN